MYPSPLLVALLACGSSPSEPAPESPPAAPEKPPARAIAPAWDPAACAAPDPTLAFEPVPDDEALKHTRAAVSDLDGDEAPESFTVRMVSGEGVVDLVLTLAPSTSDPVEVRTRFDYGDLVHTVPIPEVLRDKPAWRLPFEQELLRRRCPDPDPALRWLDRSPRALEWVAGDPHIPGVYGVAETDRWRVFAGQALSFDPNGPGFPRVVATDGDQDLVLVAHGVLLHDRADGAHAWLWLTDHADRPLKVPTVASATFDGGAVVVLPADDRQGKPAAIRIDRHTGGILTTGDPAPADPR